MHTYNYTFNSLTSAHKMHVLPVGDCDGGVVGGISDSFIVSMYVGM